VGGGGGAGGWGGGLGWGGGFFGGWGGGSVGGGGCGGGGGGGGGCWVFGGGGWGGWGFFGGGGVFWCGVVVVPTPPPPPPPPKIPLLVCELSPVMPCLVSGSKIRCPRGAIPRHTRGHAFFSHRVVLSRTIASFPFDCLQRSFPEVPFCFRSHMLCLPHLCFRP